MASSMYFARSNGFAEKPHLGNGLPTYSSAVLEKRHRHGHSVSWLNPVSLPIPGVRTRRLRLMVPNLLRIYHSTQNRFGKRRGPFILLTALFLFAYLLVIANRRFEGNTTSWAETLSFPDPSTLVYRREDIQRIWEWEIAAGHYPSGRRIPEQIGLVNPPKNPALSAHRTVSLPPRFRGPIATDTLGMGPDRDYPDIRRQLPNVAYPPRPIPGSVADMDVIMDHCDFSTGKYVRDCLEILRLGAGLENGARVRRAKMDEWKYIYVEGSTVPNDTDTSAFSKPAFALKAQNDRDLSYDLPKKRGAEWEPHLSLPSPPQYTPYKDLSNVCDEENPRIYHMFWTGPFTDKPYLALLSFLFTQNLGLHLEDHQQNPHVCRPKFWLWINPGPAASVPNPSAVRDMYDQLKSSPWASPFLHPKFKDVIHFKLWNTTEQLDGIPELKGEWRALRDSLFNSGGHVEKVQVEKEEEEAETAEVEVTDEDGVAVPAPSPSQRQKDGDNKANRVGSKSPSEYDRLSVILSDMARFVLCHRFGGIYLDADTILLRDWEELWGWRGAFAYRWSRLEKYNTAVLRMHKNSALGTFLFRTALKNGLDFHPMSISKYTKDAYLEGLLLRLPDALFDSAWLNTESYQRDRPPQPYFTGFQDFFETPLQSSGAPQALGIDGFFKGAYSYHFHNFWWRPFDPSRNYPDLGSRFAAGERLARQALAESSSAKLPDPEDETVLDDKQDLDWATVIKRTFEAYIRGERPNMYGEWIKW